MKKAILSLYLLFAIPTFLAAQSAISVQSIGSGEPILFLPGFATPGEIWESNAKQLLDNQSILVTYAGFGGLAPVDFPWYEQVKTDLIQFISTENFENLTLVGHSMGGNLAIDLAAAFPEMVTKVVIIDALACMREVMMPGVPAEALGYESPYNDQLLAMDQVAQDAYLDQMSQGMISNPEYQKKVKTWMQSADRKTFVYGYVDLLKLDSRPNLSKIKSPVLILVADQPFGAEALETMQKQYEQLENKEFALAAGSKHYIMLDQPEWFMDQLNSFLTQ